MTKKRFSHLIVLRRSPDAFSSLLSFTFGLETLCKSTKKKRFMTSPMTPAKSIGFKWVIHSDSWAKYKKKKNNTKKGREGLKSVSMGGGTEDDSSTWRALTYNTSIQHTVHTTIEIGQDSRTLTLLQVTHTKTD